MTDFDKIRADFPVLRQSVNGRPLIYLDNAATTQKPDDVIVCMAEYYSEYNSNIHRGVHHLSQRATQAYEDARETVRGFLGAAQAHEIIFTAGTTESINLIASTWGRKHVQRGDEILVSEMEHHSNIVPWQMLCEANEATLKVIPMNDAGELIIEELDNLLSERTRIVAVNHVSNTLGTINPIDLIIHKAHGVGAKVMIDGAQSVSHVAVDVSALDVDFYAFSSHKLFGPTGAGVLYGKEDLLNDMPPYQGGGEMISKVTFEKTEYNELPHRLEAGTPNIVGGIATAKGIEYLQSIGFEALIEQEDKLLAEATDALREIPGLRIVGEARNKVPVLSFNIDGLHHLDVGTILDQQGIAVRTGHHCTQPIMDHFGIAGTARASFAMYNSSEDIQALAQGLQTTVRLLS